MGLREIKEALRGYPNRGEVYLDGNPKGDTVLVLPDDREIEIDRRDTAEQIRAKLKEPSPRALATVDAAVAAITELGLAAINATTERPHMGIADRLKEKAQRARAVTANAVKALEDGMDAIIAEEAVVEQKRMAALAANNEALGVVKDEWDGIKSAVDILSNGEPS